MTKRQPDPLREAVDRAVIDGLVNATVARKIRSARARVRVLTEAIERLERERAAAVAARVAAEDAARTLRRQLSGVSLVCDRALRAKLIPPIPMDRDAGPGAVVEAMLVRLDEVTRAVREPGMGGFLVRLAQRIEARLEDDR